MIESLAHKGSVYLKKQVPHHPSSAAVLEYSIAMLLNVTFIVAGSIILSLFTGRTTEIVVILLSFSLLRQFSGGLHLKSGTSCAVVSTALFTLISFFDARESYPIHLLTALTLLLVATYAPSNFKRQHNVREKYYPWLTLISMLLVCSNFFFVSSPLAASFFVQSLTLIKRKGMNSAWKK
ncbi:accessory gene regulator B family protein [Paenibacillus sp. Marseille-Q4541]|uniref:accessory gene regulator B family protein n=1 Tax=Paenibacillus sp. Marseille-Q4541 TaxID=2831522 RepID=UPI001BABFF37|nr:accessory gene regulator B family protein [Paenibacillus sp. Marseille-Q4541]